MIGNGNINSVEIPENMLTTAITPNSKENSGSERQAMESFCEKLFPDLELNILDRRWLEGRAILAPTNKEVQILNDLIISKLPGTADVLCSQG